MTWNEQGVIGGAAPASSLGHHRSLLAQKIDTILVHADPFALGLKGELTVERLRDPELELPRICLIGLGLRDRITILDRGGEPGPLGVLGRGERPFQRISAGKTALELRIRDRKATFIHIRDDLHPIGKAHISFKRLHPFRSFLHRPRHLGPFGHRPA